MAYKVRATRNEDGSYALSYGKGAKKLEARLSQIEGKWVVTMDGSNGDPHKLKRQAIAEWEAWAVGAYNEALGGYSEGPGSGAEPEPVIEDRTVTALTGGTNRATYTENTSKVEPETEPLPNVGPGDAIAAVEKYEVREQIPTARFPYEGGFAIVERATNIQYGWSKAREQAFESLFQKA